MKKIIFLFLVIFIASCSLGTNTQESVSGGEKVTQVDNNQDKLDVKNEKEEKNSNNVPKSPSEKLSELGNTTEEILSSYYSEDAGKQKQIKDWLSDKNNIKTNHFGDIIEFLDFCEEIKRNVKNIGELNDFLYNESKEEYYNFANSKNKLSTDEFKSKILNYFNNSSIDDAGIYYKKMILDFLEKGQIECKKYVD